MRSASSGESYTVLDPRMPCREFDVVDVAAVLAASGSWRPVTRKQVIWPPISRPATCWVIRSHSASPVPRRPAERLCNDCAEWSRRRRPVVRRQ